MTCQLCQAKFRDHSNCHILYDQIAFYTLEHKDREFFIHQLLVDSYGAQHLTEESKPIAAAFTILGLYLFSEGGYTGKQVQLAHMQLGETKKEYPEFILPKDRGQINAEDVLNTAPGQQRDEMIKKWAKSTWEAFSENRPKIINMLKEADFKDLK